MPGQQTRCFTLKTHQFTHYCSKKSAMTAWTSTNMHTCPGKVQLGGWLGSVLFRKSNKMSLVLLICTLTAFPAFLSYLPTEHRQPAGGSVFSQIPGQPGKARLHTPPVGVGRRLFSPGHLGSMHRALMDASPIVQQRAWIG